MRTLALRFNLVVVVLVAMLATGRGLPGFVQAARADQTHVCTCATGGDHASCPVCNPALAEQPYSSAPAVRGVPCGGSNVVDLAAGEASTLPRPIFALARPFVRLAVPHLVSPAERDILIEPAIPPPRRAAT